MGRDILLSRNVLLHKLCLPRWVLQGSAGEMLVRKCCEKCKCWWENKMNSFRRLATWSRKCMVESGRGHHLYWHTFRVVRGNRSGVIIWVSGIGNQRMALGSWGSWRRKITWLWIRDHQRYFLEENGLVLSLLAVCVTCPCEEDTALRKHW